MIMGRNSRFLTENDRVKIECYLKQKLPVAQIAKELCVHRSTIYREIKRGQVQLVDTQLRPYWVYSSQVAQRNHEWMQSSKGSAEKIGNNHGYLKALANRILDGASPEESLYAVTGFEIHISKQTLYRYINKGYLPGVTLSSLPQKIRKCRKHRIKRVNTLCPFRKSIEYRPKEINERKTFGHWEIDSVIGKSKGKRESALTLTERITRQDIVIKVPEKTAMSTLKTLKRLKSYFGKDWYTLFKSITCDNGSEFQFDFAQLGITAYWCHPSCPHERGTNENTNRLIRRKLPKGKSLSSVTAKQALDVQTWVNNYHRPMFGGRTSNEMFFEEISKLKLNFPERVYSFFQWEN